MHASRPGDRAMNRLSQSILQSILRFTAYADLLAAACEASALAMTSCQTTWYKKLETDVGRLQS